MGTIKDALTEASTTLTPHSESPRLDAEILLGHVLKQSRTFLFTHPENELSSEQKAKFNQLVAKRQEGVPIAYLIGTREFWSLPLKVTKDTLIPRPETEQLVELTLAALKDIPNASVLDLGTGSGAIALALATERPDWKICASDTSIEALKVARHNASELSISNVDFIHSYWFDSIPYQTFHAIVSNPPYIPKGDPHLNQGDVRFEPRSALQSGIEGLDDIQKIIHNASHFLTSGGVLLIEHGYDQKTAILSLLNQHGYDQTQCWQDWQGHDRISGGIHP
ncbi:peptide chain release factor N(5)-glutamine methyltransferase [Legionella yabuuchiae]|uniref:peptide chain release factor N(5)-glutamine methyltransferase n=1 Tax=Legionella yabuuchiae TaxID=376727 RepID=UPI001055B24B|nr:peptide chain release factor N(5)-glutamine methyltransferase [Legionella yabuuchiae]